MAVKITQINDLSELQTKISQYSTSMSDASNAAQTTFTAKLEGSEAGSVTQFVGVMNQLKSDAFAQLPQATTNFAQALQTYHSALTGAGFNNLIKSVKPTVEDEYCQKVTSTEYEKFEEKANDIKVVINEVAGVLPEVSDSKIESLLTTLNSDIQGKTNEIKTTRSTVQEAQTAFKAALEAVTAELTQCISSIENTMNITDPKSGLKPANMVKFIQQGIGAPVLSAMTNKTDVKAMNYLAEEKYDKLFELNPDKLSNNMYGMMVNYVQNLVGRNDTDQVMKFVNGLLGQIGGEASTRVEKYLTNFSNQTALQMQQLADMQILMCGTSNSDTKAIEEMYRNLLMSNMLWESMLLLKPNKTEHLSSTQGNATLYTYSKMTGLSFQRDPNGKNPDISFGLSSYQVSQITSDLYKDINGKPIDKSLELKKESKQIGVQHYNSKADWNKADNQAKLAEIRKQQRDFIGLVVKDGLLFATGIFAPEVAVGIGVIEAIAKSTSTSQAQGVAKGTKPVVDALDKYYADKYPDQHSSWKTGINASYDFVNKGLSLWDTKQDLNSKEIKQRLNVFYEMVDAGGLSVSEGTEKTSVTLTTNLDYRQQMRVAEITERGYGSFFDRLDNDSANAIKNQLGTLQKDGSYKPKSPEAAFILYGGDPLSVEKLDTIEETLTNAIKSSKADKDESLRNAASKWFTDSNHDRLFQQREFVNAP